MNLVLNTPLSAIVSKQEYDNRILFVFLLLMFVLVMSGLMFVSLTKGFSNKTPDFTIDEQSSPTQIGEYV